MFAFSIYLSEGPEEYSLMRARIDDPVNRVLEALVQQHVQDRIGHGATRIEIHLLTKSSKI